MDAVEQNENSGDTLELSNSGSDFILSGSLLHKTFIDKFSSMIFVADGVLTLGKL